MASGCALCKKKKFIFSIALAVCVMLMSATSMSYMIITVLLIYTLLYEKIPLKWQGKNYVTLYVGLNVLLFCVITKLGPVLNIGNLSLNGRGFIWEKAIESFLKSPIWGYGVHGTLIQVFWSKWSGDGSGMNYMHNQLLQVANDGGLILLVLYVLMIYAVMDSIDKIPNKRIKKRCGGYTISTVMILITSAINNSLMPYIYKSIASGDKKGVKSTTRVLVILVAGLCVVTMTFAPEVIRVFAGKKYMDAIYVIPPVAASVFFIFLYSLFSTIEYYYQKTGFIAIATCICAVANLILNYIFINIYGYYAAGYTTVVCYIGLACLHYFFYRKVSKEEDCGNIYDGKLCVILSVTVLAVMLIMALTYQYSWVRYGFFVLVIAVAAIFRNQIKDTIVSFRK